MEKKLKIVLKGYKVTVVVKEATYFHRTIYYAYGQICVSAPLTYNHQIYEYLDRIVSEKYLKALDPEMLYDEDYCYILGEKRNLIRPFSNKTIERNDIVIRDDEDLKKKLAKFSLTILKDRVAHYEKIMGIPPHNVKITGMFASYGKNYVNKRLLTFARELIHFSLELIDSVVIHELAHYFEHNHSSKFYDIVYKYCPNYKECKTKLKNGVKK